MRDESLSPVVPSTARAQSIAIFLNLSSSRKLSASCADRVTQSDCDTADCNSALFLLQSRMRNRSSGRACHTIPGLLSSHVLPGIWRKKCLHALNLNLAGLGPPEEAVKNRISRFVYALHVACGGAAQARPACLLHSCSRALALRVITVSAYPTRGLQLAFQSPPITSGRTIS
jgi:hypothetical protein